MMHCFSEFLDKFLQTMYFERRAHDDQEIWALGEITGLNGGDIVPERMRLVVQDDSWTQGADADCSCRASYSIIT